MPKIRTIDEAVEKLYEPHVGVVGTGRERHERPHKPVLLLTVFDLIARGCATSQRIPWSQELRDRFSEYFSVVRRNDDDCTPKNPFCHLRGD